MRAKSAERGARRINEIFYSLQGEGHHTGVPSVFVRFSGCNLRCPFCDTRHEQGRLMTLDEIAAEVNRHPADWIILTGGEPSLWIDADFINDLKTATGKQIAIETNGTNPLPEGIDWITISPKDAPVVANHADEIKVVDLGQDLEQYFGLACRRPDTRMYLQPCWVPDEAERLANQQRTVRRVLADPRWTLSLQTHRFLNIQ